MFQQVRRLFAAHPGRTGLVEHTIRLKTQVPVRQRLRVIEPSHSEWCSPVVILVKKDGSLRICIDFRKLNAMSEFDAYPMPRIVELLERIGRAR